ncbi:hypothetical protein ACH5RR_009598 [Cinchona calisaya]|uniref:Chromo domain-containing protein n=1 Tax=Cinchona calisaya TaxID=153742 RepID=A0ABD3AGZ5_9GENT
MAHDIPTGSDNTLPQRMTCQEQAFSQLMDWLDGLPVCYNLMTNLREIKAISVVLREHMRTVDATLDSLRQDLSAKVNDTDILAMVDTGATHSFVTGREVRRLKLELKEHGYRIKAVNSEAQPVLGVALVELTLDPWSGKCSLMAVPLDDFDLILGKKFMATNKIFSIPHLDGVMIVNKMCPTFIPSIFVNTNAIAGRRQAKRALPIKWKQFEKEASKVLDHRTMGQSKNNRRTDYLIHWKGETEAETTWERDVTLW